MKISSSRQSDSVVAAVVLVLASWGLSSLLLAILALPAAWLWNRAVVPLGPAPIGFRQAFGLLLLSFIFQVARDGVRLSATLRD